jgi:hypothetical protein
LVDLGIAAAFSIAITIAKERSIAVSIGLKRHIAIVIGALAINFRKVRLGNPENDPVGVDLGAKNLLYV